MSKPTRICRVCGKEYVACHSTRTGSGVFNWREVACSPQCGVEYFKRISDSRTAVQEPELSVDTDEIPDEDLEYGTDDDMDEDLDEDLDDEDDSEV